MLFIAPCLPHASPRLGLAAGQPGSLCEGAAIGSPAAAAASFALASITAASSSGCFAVASPGTAAATGAVPSAGGTRSACEPGDEHAVATTIHMSVRLRMAPMLLAGVFLNDLLRVVSDLHVAGVAIPIRYSELHAIAKVVDRAGDTHQHLDPALLAWRAH